MAKKNTEIDIDKLVTFEQAAVKRGLEKGQVMDACNRYIDRSPNAVYRDPSTQVQYFDPEAMDSFLSWWEQNRRETSDGRRVRSVPRTDIEIAQGELTRATLAVERAQKRIAKHTSELEKAQEALREAEYKKSEFERKIAFFKNKARNAR